MSKGLNTKKKLTLNAITSFIFQLVVIICGFLIPRLILKQYGSEVNGLVNSIGQFLAIVTFLDLGIGAVIQSSFYRSLAQNDMDETSRIARMGKKFFRKIAIVLLVYVIVIVFVFPFFNESSLSYWSTALLVGCIGIGYFFQYYFGVVDGLLLASDQKTFISNIVQISSYLLNALCVILIIKFGGTIHVVKFVSSLIFLIRPFVFHIYVKRKYKLNNKIDVSKSKLNQKWNGLAQHVATVVLDSTDIVVLTIFTNYQIVSIYAVYKLVVFNLEKLIESVFSNVEAILGELWNKNDKEGYAKLFKKTTWALHTASTLLFGIGAMLIVQFVQVYTIGVPDTASYVVPLFAYLITAAYWSCCIRINYTLIVRSTCRYKETQLSFIVATIINIALSIALVNWLGLVGVAIGTVVAMFVQTVWLAIYTSKNVIEGSFKIFMKQLLVDIVEVGVIVAATFWLKMGDVSIMSWIILALEVSGVALVVFLLINMLFYRTEMCSIIRKFFKKKEKVDESN